jgi:hypothetical protein
MSETRPLTADIVPHHIGAGRRAACQVCWRARALDQLLLHGGGGDEDIHGRCVEPLLLLLRGKHTASRLPGGIAPLSVTCCCMLPSYNRHCDGASGADDLSAQVLLMLQTAV